MEGKWYPHPATISVRKATTPTVKTEIDDLPVIPIGSAYHNIEELARYINNLPHLLALQMNFYVRICKGGLPDLHLIGTGRKGNLAAQLAIDLNHNQQFLVHSGRSIKARPGNGIEGTGKAQ
jgi:hypothetical protein